MEMLCLRFFCLFCFYLEGKMAKLGIGVLQRCGLREQEAEVSGH